LVYAANTRPRQNRLVEYQSEAPLLASNRTIPMIIAIADNPVRIGKYLSPVYHE